MIIDAYVAGIAQYLINGVRKKRLPSVRKPALMQCFDDLPRDFAGRILLKDISHGFCLFFVYEYLFIDDLISVGNAAADKVAFLSALVLPATDLLRKLSGIVLRKADHDVFEDDAVQVLRAVYILRRPLRGGNEYFPVLMQPLFVDGDLNGISAEPVKSIDNC